MRTGIAAFIISFACCICTFYVQTMVSVCAYIQARDYERIRRGPENFRCFFYGSLDLKKINFKKLIKNKNPQAADTRRNTNNPVTGPWRSLSFIKHILATHPAYALLGLCKKKHYSFKNLFFFKAFVFSKTFFLTPVLRIRQIKTDFTYVYVNYLPRFQLRGNACVVRVMSRLPHIPIFIGH